MSEQVTKAELAPQPSHVPDSVVFDFDMYRDPGYLANPHDRLLDLLQSAPPIFWTPQNGGHWIFLNYSANFTAARDPDSFSSEWVPFDQLQEIRQQMPPDAPHLPLPYPIMLDPPIHTTYRLPLQATFSPKTIKGLEGDIRKLAIEIIKRAAAEDRCEFMADIAEPLPIRIFLKMLGLPAAMMPEYRALVKEQLSENDPDPTKGLMRLQRMTAAMRDTVLARRDDPKDDIISMLWGLEIDGKPTTLEDLENYGVLLFIAGLDTVVNGMGYAVYHLARDQALQAELRGNRDLIPEAVEEMLRRYSFVIPPRRVKRDLEFHGLQMKENERIMLFLPAAGLDDSVFPHAADFDIARDNKAHIVFNAGPHRCLGSHLARLELQIFYEELLSGLPPFRLDADCPPIFKCGQIIGIEQLGIVWDS